MDVPVGNESAEHLTMAADHLETAARQHREAAKLCDARNEDKAADQLRLARSEVDLAQDHGQKAIKGLGLSK